MRNNILLHSNPETKEEIASNLVYLIRENTEMKNFEAFTLSSTLESSNTDSVRWPFLKKVLPELNDVFNKSWEKYQLKENNKEIEILEKRLKSML